MGAQMQNTINEKAGPFADDPTWDGFMESVEEHRRQVDQDQPFVETYGHRTLADERDVMGRTVEQALAIAEMCRTEIGRGYGWPEDLVLLADEVLRLRGAHIESERQLRDECDEIGRLHEIILNSQSAAEPESVKVENL